MKLATLSNNTPDGALVVSSPDADRYLKAPRPTLQAALEDWPAALAEMSVLERRLCAGEGEPLQDARLDALLPRAWQWLDASAFKSHGKLMQTAYKLPPMTVDQPVMYQGMSHRFLGPAEDAPFPTEDHGIDFEAEYAVITLDVPMGVSPAEAVDRIALVTLVNDWSLRVLAPGEMRTGFGWIHAKPACSMAAFGLTPSELGDTWRDGRVCLPLTVELNGERFGSPNGSEMSYGFHELIAHAARTRDLPAGTVIGSGTVSNEDADAVGSCCISERQALEIIAGGAARTPFMRFGDEVCIYAERHGTADTLFGRMRQRACPAPRSGSVAAQA